MLLGVNKGKDGSADDLTRMVVCRRFKMFEIYGFNMKWIRSGLDMLCYCQLYVQRVGKHVEGVGAKKVNDYHPSYS